MSYNIDTIRILYKSDDFNITRDVYLEMKDRYEEDAPGNSIFSRSWGIAKGIWWSDEGSGHSEPLLRHVLSQFDGEVDLLLTWEGGDSITGLRLRNHVVTEHVVDHVLGKEIKRRV